MTKEELREEYEWQRVQRAIARVIQKRRFEKKEREALQKLGLNPNEVDFSLMCRRVN